jgi:hypothetical protein
MARLVSPSGRLSDHPMAVYLGEAVSLRGKGIASNQAHRLAFSASFTPQLKGVFYGA